MYKNLTNLCEKTCKESLCEGKDTFPFWHSNPLNRIYKVPFCGVEGRRESRGNHFLLSTSPPYKMHRWIPLSFYWRTCWIEEDCSLLLFDLSRNDPVPVAFYHLHDPDHHHWRVFVSAGCFFWISHHSHADVELSSYCYPRSRFQLIHLRHISEAARSANAPVHSRCHILHHQRLRYLLPVFVFVCAN